jgi:FecR-like protein
MNLRLLLIACLMAPSVGLDAVSLQEAHVTKIVNKVKVVDPSAKSRPARLNDVIRDQIAVETGAQSRSELQFQDQTLTRIGPETFFSFAAGTRDLTLGRGTMLLQVPKAHGGATIHSAMVTATITGTTVIIENLPGKIVKALVLEGSMRIAMKGKFGDSVLLGPGQMTIVPPDAKRIPSPVTVDLSTVMKTSSLVNMGNKKGEDVDLPSEKLIKNNIANQDKAKDKSELMPAGYVIHGGNFQEHGNGAEAAGASERANGHGRADNNGNHYGNGNGNGNGNGHGHGHHGGH